MVKTNDLSASNLVINSHNHIGVIIKNESGQAIECYLAKLFPTEEHLYCKPVLLPRTILDRPEAAFSSNRSPGYK